VYSVETESAAVSEVAALPAHALPAYAELISLLEVATWPGNPYNLQRPDANMRTHTFADEGRGLAIYLVLAPWIRRSATWWRLLLSASLTRSVTMARSSARTTAPGSYDNVPYVRGVTTACYVGLWPGCLRQSSGAFSC